MSDRPDLSRLTETRGRTRRHMSKPPKPSVDPIPFVSVLGLLIGASFFAASLTPSLIPREAVTQGVLGGVVAAIGYLIGIGLHWLWRFLQLPLPDRTGRWARRGVAGVIATGIAAWALWHAADWQNLTRETAGVPLVETSHPLVIAGVAVGVFLIALLLAWVFSRVLSLLGRLIGRLLPERIALVLGLLATFWVFWALIDGLLVQRALEAADASFEAADILIEPDIPQPTEPMKTGSDTSLIRWEEMGRWGRSYVGLAPTLAELEAFSDTALEPIRVYVGRRSAETAQARAELALAELIRVGGFERSNLLVMVPTGTGWMDPGGQDTFEFVLGGDTATVAVQYSYLTSILSLLTHPEYGLEQARVLFQVIYDYWADLPQDARPRFFVHGLSQGAFNSQSTIPLLDVLADPIDGALWVGSPFLSRFWATIREGRDTSSPEWQARFGNGSLVRTANQAGVDPGAGAPWGPVRLVFLNYGSDPIVTFSFDSAFRRPDWMQDPRAPDVPPELPWFPLVTMFQMALDMTIALQVPRHGHYYVAEDYIDPWAEVVAPTGWTAERSEELKAVFRERASPW